MRAWSRWAVLAILAAFLARPGVGAPARKAPAGGGQPSLQKGVQAAVRRGLDYLRKAQQADGSWQNYPGTTAVCVMAFLRNGVTERDPAVARACAFLASHAKPNGAIYTDRFGPGQALPNYNTALALTALHLTGNPRYAPIVRRAQEYLRLSQYDEGEGYSPKDPQYGGIGYGSREDNPDLSNLQTALEALRESGYPKNADVFRKAIVFLQRCQNRSDSNDQPWAGTDGGFVYASSGESKADPSPRRPPTSYGSMTYAGLKSYIYCNVGRSDPRVQAAWSWIRGHYDVTRNPNLGTAGLYYYYHTMSKTLAIWGERVLQDTSGRRHLWARDLAAELIRRQRADGSWANDNPRWWENRPELVTGYSLIALAYCRKGL